MALTLSKLNCQIAQMGPTLAAQSRQHENLMEEASQLLHRYAQMADVLAAQARLAAEQKWYAAIPASAPLDAAVPVPPHPARTTLIASDGSPVEPDRHGPALYYLLNIGSMIYRPGSGQRPQADSEPHLFFQEEDLYEGNRLVQGNLLDTRLATAELAKLADLVQANSDPEGFTLALGDGTLLLWLLEESTDQRIRQIRAYLSHFARIHEAGAAMVAFSSRPRNTDVLHLLFLASLDRDFRRDDRANYPYHHLTDRELFSFLEPGKRSATFISSLPINQDYRDFGARYETRFFYLNVSHSRQPEIARVEMPRWVTEEHLPCPSLSDSAGAYTCIDAAHAAIYEQCRLAGNYPYVLARAHELALVSVAERQDLDLRILAAMAKAGLSPRPSEKARLKELTASSRRRIS